MPTLLIPRTVARRPTWPWHINWDCWEAQGLRLWFPMSDAPLIEMVSGGVGKLGPNLFLFGKMGPFQVVRKKDAANVGAAVVATPNRTNFDVNFRLPGITISFWYQTPRLGVAMNLIVCDVTTAGLLVQMGTGATLNVSRADATVARANSTTTAILADQCNHFLVTMDNTTATAAGIRIYVNGLEGGYASSTNGSGTIPTASGAYSVGPGLTSGAMMTDVRVYDYVMSPSQAMALYQNAPHWELYAPVKKSIQIGTSQRLPYMGVQ